MCLYEYDEEKQREFDREEGREEGRQELLEEQILANVKKGYSKEMIADFLGVDLKTIEAVIAGLVEKICRKAVEKQKILYRYRLYNTDIGIQNFKLSFSDNMLYWIL